MRSAFAACLRRYRPAALFAVLCLAGTSWAQNTPSTEPLWVELVPGEHVALNGYTLVLTHSPDDGTGMLKVRTDTGEEKSFITSDARFPAFASLGPRKRYLVANMGCATKSRCVYVGNLEAGTSWTISEPARERYVRDHLSSLPRHSGSLYVSPSAVAISPDESRAVLEMKLVSITYPTRELAEKDPDSKLFVKTFYVVDMRSGAVLETMDTFKNNSDWWNE